MVEHLCEAARLWPHKTALTCLPSGRRLTFAELEQRANRSAHALRALGLMPGDGLSICMPNSPEMVATVCAALRLGLYFTLLPNKASAQDLKYVVDNSESKVLLIASAVAACDAVAQFRSDGWPVQVVRVDIGDDAQGPWAQQLAAQSPEPPAHCLPGMEMIYSSGTTGKPKGIRKPLPTWAWNAADPRNVGVANEWGIDEHSVCLSTSPLYHSAPHRFLAASLNRGASVVLMEHFDAQLSLQAIAQFACTHSLWVPTMFHRLLHLDADLRARHSVASMARAIHGAAPCPVHVKQAMIDWWGPILSEYYSGTEGVGGTFIDSTEWLQHKGSVGRPRDCSVHILGEDGQELAADAVGQIYFESKAEFSYWRDADKTRAATNAQGWRTFGDMGYLDADGYLYLTDRKDFMIISGGVNIYPQEIESALSEHPGVADVAVFGVPDDEFGERVVAVVQPAHAAANADEMRAYCQSRLGKIKAPKQIVFLAEFPRLDTGKLHKKRLRERFIDGTLQHPQKGLLHVND